jgi:hypothetical protein
MTALLAWRICDVLFVSRNPISRDGPLSSRKIDLACANHRVQTVFETVLDPRVPLDVIGLQPEIFKPIRSSQFQGDQMIDFTAFALFFRAAVFSVSFAFDCCRNVPYELRVAVRADIGLRDIQHVTLRQPRIWQATRLGGRGKGKAGK